MWRGRENRAIRVCLWMGRQQQECEGVLDLLGRIDMSKTAMLVLVSSFSFSPSFPSSLLSLYSLLLSLLSTPLLFLSFSFSSLSLSLTHTLTYALSALNSGIRTFPRHMETKWQQPSSASIRGWRRALNCSERHFLPDRPATAVRERHGNM